MNKRYMDFVPKGAEGTTPRQFEKRPLSGMSAGRVSGNATVAERKMPLGGVSRGTTISGNATVSRSAMPGMRAPVSMDMRRRVVSHANVKTLPEASPWPAMPVRASVASVRELPHTGAGVATPRATASVKRATGVRTIGGAQAGKSSGLTVQNFAHQKVNTPPRPATPRTQMILPSQPKTTPVRRAPMAAKTTQVLAARAIQAPGAQAAKTPFISKKTFTKADISESKKQALLREQILEDALREAELEEPAPKKSRISSLSLKSLVRPGEKNRGGKDETKKDEGKSKIPRSPFINTENLNKRPLSGAREVAPEPAAGEVELEEKKGVVTIIAKPEKDSRAGLIVAVILTIILGAAAGTIAFLILPK